MLTDTHVINIHTTNKNKTEVIFIVIIKKNLQKTSTGFVFVNNKRHSGEKKEENREGRLSLTLFKKFSRLQGFHLKLICLLGSRPENIRRSRSEKRQELKTLYIYLYIRMPIFLNYHHY